MHVRVIALSWFLIGCVATGGSFDAADDQPKIGLPDRTGRVSLARESAIESVNRR